MAVSRVQVVNKTFGPDHDRYALNTIVVRRPDGNYVWHTNSLAEVIIVTIDDVAITFNARDPREVNAAWKIFTRVAGMSPDRAEQVYERVYGQEMAWLDRLMYGGA